MGITSNGGSAALSEKSLVFAAEAERSCELGALGTSAGGGNTCPCIRTWAEGDEKDVPNVGAFTPGWMALLKGVQRFLPHTPRPPGQRLHFSLKLSLSGLDNGRPIVGELHNGWR